MCTMPKNYNPISADLEPGFLFVDFLMICIITEVVTVTITFIVTFIGIHKAQSQKMRIISTTTPTETKMQEFKKNVSAKKKNVSAKKSF